MAAADSFNELDRMFMRRALDLASCALGNTSPNPVVGCVLVKEGKIVGEGYHRQAGTPHAEVHALRAAGEKARGATAYVSLEPCSHFGRTPPCADALIAAGIKRAVIAMQDPNPLVAGQGIRRLKDAEIEVKLGLLEPDALRLNEAFIKVMTAGLPFVTYKSAFTLDGKIATEKGDSRWVSNERSRQLGRYLRHINDVILVGSETVLHDDPALTCRLPLGRDPVRVVVDGMLRIPARAKVLTPSPALSCVIATSAAASPAKIAALRAIPGVEVWPYPSRRYVPLDRLMRDIAQKGWNSVLLEGGGTLAGEMMAQKLIDKVDFFLALKLIGGQGPSPLSGLHLDKMSAAIALLDPSWSMETGDLRITGYIPK